MKRQDGVDGVDGVDGLVMPSLGTQTGSGDFSATTVVAGNRCQMQIERGGCPVIIWK